MKRQNICLKVFRMMACSIIVFFVNTSFAQDTVPGTALNFDGTNYVQCGDSGSIGIGNEMTVEAWIKVSSSFPAGDRVGNITGKYNHSPNFNFEGHTNGQLRFFWNGGEINAYATNFDMRDDIWHHVAVTRDSLTNQIIFYTDGKVNGIFAAGSNADYHWPLRIGADFRSDPGLPFHGLIEEVRLWNTARTAQEIRENMHLTLSGSETGLVSYWQFNEASGDTTYDAVGGNNGTLYNMDPTDWIASTVPVGGGNSFTQIVSSTGILDFTGTGLSMDFTVKTGTDIIVASRLDLAPNTTHSNYSTFNSQYWVVNKYGSGTFTTDLTFTPNEVITPEDETSPGALRLFNRTSNSDESWSNMMGAALAGASGNTATFSNISSFSQFIIGRQWFVDIPAGLTGVWDSYIAWGDYDNDGDLDILLTGRDAVSGNNISRIYRNNNGVFNYAAGLTGVWTSSVAWGDYDNDGDLDILLTGQDDSDNLISRIYRNNSGAFENIEAGLTGVWNSSVAWGDYDNDGDLDILLTGATTTSYPSNPISRIYRNDSGVFSNINAGLPGIDGGSVAWGDYDNDGDLDILLTGSPNSGRISRIYRNNDGVFTYAAGLTGVDFSSVAWGDYDNDGDLDILMSGWTGSSAISRIYRNDDGAFSNIDAGLTGIYWGSAAWGDYDNDGDLDILLTGYYYDDSDHYISRIYRNDSGVFTNINAGLTGVCCSSAAWGDYDNDSDLDILLTGTTSIYYPYISISKIYRNNSSVPNTVPFSPDGLTAAIYADSLTFFWNKAGDNETPQDGLSYNLLIGNSEFDTLIMEPMANVTNGYRRIPAIGNVCQVTSCTYQLPKEYSYTQVIPPDYWGVQSIDHAYAGSPFTTDSMNIQINYLQTINNYIMKLTDTLAWEIQFGDFITSYQVQIDDDSTFNDCEVNETLLVSISDSGYYSIHLQYLYGTHNLVEGTKYYWRIKPNYTSCLPTAFTKPAPSFWFGYETAIDDEIVNAIPNEFDLMQNYPNPFNPETHIKYALPKNAHVTIEMYDMLGRKIKTLLDGQKKAGYHALKINAGSLASGVYMYRIQAENFIQTKKMLLMK